MSFPRASLLSWLTSSAGPFCGPTATAHSSSPAGVALPNGDFRIDDPLRGTAQFQRTANSVLTPFLFVVTPHHPGLRLLSAVWLQHQERISTLRQVLTLHQSTVAAEHPRFRFLLPGTARLFAVQAELAPRSLPTSKLGYDRREFQSGSSSSSGSDAGTNLVTDRVCSSIASSVNSSGKASLTNHPGRRLK